GKYIAPQMIESTLMVDKFIDQVVIIANERKYVSALIVPEYRLLEEYARDCGIKFADREELCADKRINKMIAERIATLQQTLAGYEQVKKFTLLPHHLSMEKGELTNTLKVRRNVLNKNYAAEIEKMYEE
ncbi:MAG: long-chain fatty acid--CoA ligase, partial [Prevotella sp.]|nr:long-chain fatty acid--CoA ligase [Prevotella sp.]